MSYAVREVFLTLQGEGARTGSKAVFIRLAGCNLWTGREEDRAKGKGACALWCDTDFFKGTKMDALAIVQQCEDLWPVDGDERWVVVTGGEPSLQLDAALVSALHDAGWQIAVETNGTLPLPDGLDWVTLSPKLGGPVTLGRADEVKIVLPGHLDPEKGWTTPALLTFAEVYPEAALYVQPQDDPLVKHNAERCVAWVMQHPRWRLSWQVHKSVNLP